jgi:hypothetical protein
MSGAATSPARNDQPLQGRDPSGPYTARESFPGRDPSGPYTARESFPGRDTLGPYNAKEPFLGRDQAGSEVGEWIYAGERVEPGQALHRTRQAQDVRSAPRGDGTALARPRLFGAGPPSVAVGNQASPLSPPALQGRLSWDPLLGWLLLIFVIGVVGGLGFEYLVAVMH